MPFLDAAATPRLWRSFYVPHFGPKGAYTYDVCTGRGVPQKQTTVLISCVSVTVTRGGGRGGEKMKNNC